MRGVERHVRPARPAPRNEDQRTAPPRQEGVERRQILGLGLALLFGKVVTACGDAATAGAAGTDAGPGGASDPDAGAAADAEAAEATADAASVPWATGGTKAMTDRATYPNPFAGGVPSACSMTCELTAGPCYSAQSEVIQDISYGYEGLPTRLYFQVVDEACKPVPGASVDVWHVSAVGKYSGNDAANEDVAFCTGNDSAFTSKLYFRGKQVTDANGLVFFDTCFPGWYSSRTIHVHLTVRVGDDAYVTTQLCFDDRLDDDIVKSQALYASRGSRDTSNTTDTVFSASDYGDYQFQTGKMSDGALLAWKTIVLRSSLSEAICAPAGECYRARWRGHATLNRVGRSPAGG